MKGTTRKMIGLGIVAAMRTSFAPAVLSHFLSKSPNRRLKHSRLKFIQSPTAALITKVLAAQEIVVDKLPTTPNRTGFPQILGRIASGAFAGSVIAITDKENVLKGALLGGASALLTSYGCFYLRRYLDEIPGVKDIYVATAEDAIAIAGGIALMK
jgi:uncharacterized membrane protein